VNKEIILQNNFYWLSYDLEQTQCQTFDIFQNLILYQNTFVLVQFARFFKKVFNMQQKEIKEVQKSKAWFRKKSHGWGWQPDSWQGWMIVFSMVVFNIFNFFRLNAMVSSVFDILPTFIIETILSIVVLIFICYKKSV
jgi:hypothetical protein